MPNERFYQSNEWHRLRSKVKARWKKQGLPCAWCNQPIDWSARPIADHVVPRKARPDLALDASNIVIMHMGCHNAKTHKAERMGVEVPVIGADGFAEGSDWG